ncbi:MAG TPA: pyrimidine utilization protein D [Franconibacter helveticus]|uniref:pyrimidine utilization protein D n=1 Tax=Franconibacter helveticus TaxID=357240 RepID=UPI000DA24F7C|nr:pyrimidine utilization protein D [Franconibacter helveticus]HAZ55045.1 pyrimidine utilization protein D [Franconibacter helveticus]
MNLTLTPAPYPGAPVLVLIAGLGGAGSYWLPQRAALEPHYQLVIYDQRGTGNNPDILAQGYSLSEMAHELYDALLAHGVSHFGVMGHALGGHIGMQLALDYPQAVASLVIINGWLRLNPHTRRCFAVRERLLQACGAPAYLEAQPLFLYPADWMAANQPRLEAEEALHNAHFQGAQNLQRRLAALKAADFSQTARAVTQPVLLVCARDDLLVPWICSAALHEALPDSRLEVLPWGAHACNVTASEAFNALALAFLAATLSSPPSVKEAV